MEQVVGFVTMLALPGYVVLQLWMARSYRGAWRAAALVPLAVMAPLLAYSLYAFAGGSNLWPLLLILAAPFACTYLAIVMAARFISA